MALFLSRTDTGSDPYSTGSGTNPIQKSITLDGSSDPANEQTTPKPIYLYATDEEYTEIVVTIINTPVGITWEISETSDGTYGSSVTPLPMDATANDQLETLWLRATVANDGSVGTQVNTACQIRVQAVESSGPD